MNDADKPIMEGKKQLSVQVVPVGRAQNMDGSTLCNIVDPDFVHVTIDDLSDDSMWTRFALYFNQIDFKVFFLPSFEKI